VRLIKQYFVQNGAFAAAEVTLQDVLGAHDTPLYVYNADVVRHKYELLRQRFPAFEVFYSLKANPSLALCTKLRSLGARGEVSSLGELTTVLGAGFEPENIVFVGPAKKNEEIAAALEAGIYGVVTDSAHELRLIERLASERGRHVRVLLRINTFEQPKGLQEVMVGGPSKFGFDEERVVEQVRQVRLRHAHIGGIQVYSASQVLDAEFLADHLRIVMELAIRLSDELGFELECIDFGGGFGVPYTPDETQLDLATVAEQADRLLEVHRDRLRGCRLVFEVGRFLVAEAGIFITRVLRVKESRGKTFVVTDGGMNHFTRHAFMGVAHPIRLLNRISDRPDGEYEVVGPCCTPLDVLGRAVPLPHPEAGDIVGVFNAGAYGYSMSMLNFLSFGWPKEVLADSGHISVIRDAKSASDVLEGQHHLL
jgi:diaminopimelate decarboxylase